MIKLSGALWRQGKNGGRAHRKVVPILGFRYIKEWGFCQLKYMKGERNQSFGSLKGPKRVKAMPYVRRVCFHRSSLSSSRYMH